MSQFTNKSLSKEQVKAVESAKSVGDVEALLAAAGEHHWRDLGDRPGNAATVQIASNPASALIERVTNGIDGMLELEAEFHPGSLPESPRLAAREWFGVPRKGLAELPDKERKCPGEPRGERRA
jgi:hypothetical protein